MKLEIKQGLKPLVAGVGAANLDIHGRSRKGVVMRDSNPGYMATSAGGVTRNMLENLARQGVQTALMAAVGDDAFGRKILEDTSRAGVDVSHVRVEAGMASSTYIAILDDRGDMLLGMSDMRIAEALEGDYLDEHAALIEQANAVVCDACLKPAFLERLFAIAGARIPVFIDPVSTAYARQMEPLVGRFYGVKPNVMELAVLSGMPVESEAEIERAAERLLHRGTHSVAVSRGEKGCYYADANGARIFRKLRPVETMLNATGGGDAFMAGFVHGFVTNMPICERLDYALASGIVAVTSLTTISPEMSDARVRETMRFYAPDTARADA